jgi:hypothetical protein
MDCCNKQYLKNVFFVVGEQQDRQPLGTYRPQNIKKYKIEIEIKIKAKFYLFRMMNS